MFIRLILIGLIFALAGFTITGCGSSSPSGPTPFLNDHFDTYGGGFPAAPWTTAVYGSGTWSIVTDGVQGSVLDLANPGGRILNETTLTNYSFSAKIKPGNSTAIEGIMVGFNNNTKLYLLAFANGNSINLWKVDGPWNPIDSYPYSYDTSIYYTLKAIVNNDNIKCYLGTTLLFDTTYDTSYSPSKFGFYCEDMARFDDVLVYEQ